MNKTIFLMSTFVICGIGMQAHADFQSPSGNVICTTSAEDNPHGGVVCDIFKMDNTRPPQPKPSTCKSDWGQRFGVERTGKAEMYCYSDYLYDMHPTVLNYGQTLKGKTYECTSLTTGMTCKNNSGHGFTLSKNSQKLF